MPLPTWDVFIGLTFFVGIAYGFMLRREKTITTLCSVYIGLVIANNFSQTVFDFFNGNTTVANQVWVRSSASASTIAIALFLASIIFVSGAINSTSNRSGDISPLEVIVYSGLTIALVISSILGFLPEESRNHYLEASRAARMLYDLRTLIVIVPPLSLIFLNFKHR
ncbi:MAG: hypothetical protein AAB360_02460 [Patescibacteria group bacterium]